MKSTRKYYITDRKDISFFKFILEAYSGIALMKTIDAGRGKVELLISPGCEEDVDILVKNLSKTINIKHVNND
ncbi:DUF4911 domain-containing protein [Candidatus Magnetomoraceae bacterium gMMP-15]